MDWIFWLTCEDERKPERSQQPSHWLPNQLLPPTLLCCHRVKYFDHFKATKIWLENSRSKLSAPPTSFSKESRGWVSQGNLRTEWPIKSGPDGNAGLLDLFRHHPRCQICQVLNTVSQFCVGIQCCHFGVSGYLKAHDYWHCCGHSYGHGHVSLSTGYRHHIVEGYWLHIVA